LASQHETVVQAIVEQLRANIQSGSNGYVYTPESIRRITWFPVDWEPDATFRTQYIVHPGDETEVEGPESCSIKHEAEIFVVMFRQDESVESSEHWPIANDLVADATQAILSDHYFGGTANGIVGQILSDRTPTAELPGYVVAGIRFVVRYYTGRPGR
jgi:hypothetical protein